MYEYDYVRRTSESQFYLATTAPTGRRRTGLIAGTAVILLTAGLVVAAATADADAAPAVGAAKVAKTYANCTKLTKDYPHGVGRKSAVDKVSGSSRPVTNFTRNNALYEANKKSDRDGDKLACEKR